jgi:hypothetical protein
MEDVNQEDSSGMMYLEIPDFKYDPLVIKHFNKPKINNTDIFALLRLEPYKIQMNGLKYHVMRRTLHNGQVRYYRYKQTEGETLPTALELAHNMLLYSLKKAI